MANTTNKKAVTLDNLSALSGVLATKNEVKQQISDAALSGADIEFATDEEVLALFRETPAEPAE